MSLDEYLPTIISKGAGREDNGCLDELFFSLIESTALHLDVAGKEGPFEQLVALAKKRCDEAFIFRSTEALRQIHQTLFYSYRTNLAEPLSNLSLNQYHPVLLHVRHLLESRWLDSETKRCPPCLKTLTPDNIGAEIKNLWSCHKVSEHPLFDFLESEANNQQLYYFFKSDSALNLLFFDLVAMTLVGSVPETRGEISQNLWDEIGQGSNDFTHVNLYKDLLKRRDIDLPEDHFSHLYDWQGLAGHNLFMMGGVTRRHYYKLVGMMAMTELLDPSQYKKLVNGSHRLGLSERDVYYYAEHIRVDIGHADGWLNKVIEPVARRNPESLEEIYFGAQLRLQTCQDYYDNLLVTLRRI
ncbi:iron-containing redox enzyme family protein [Klebsiella quasipneumoniae]|uniref:iron-containing redox enzyme family protein n=1 Tax=Klebsiella quasipneumoniae TaxID=1463165 RepID=UPI001E46B29B|nr:iron-containing redox enzyme family protein [Klebsiella quasipneumoniae]MCD7075713.1 iron-containing redox enzyme family protein [Klebsiella quasipneumoniae subsp. similipneumoniae]MCD7102941.1 iron-containing redox enzyme family protein [Klebsiella quasipneumoniae subsp. similipneumoniae]